MLQLRSRTIVVTGVVVALFGAVVVFVYARSVTSRVGGEAAVSTFVAARDIPAGTKFDVLDSAVTRRPVPGSLRPASAITTAQFGRSGAAPGAGLEIPPGHNAVTMNLAPPQGVANYAQAGDLVNIYVTLRNAGPSGSSITKLLLPNVQVLANRSAGAPQREGATGGEVLLTLALTPDAAEKVIFAKENGSLWFGLVRPGDAPAATGGRNAQNVLS